MSLQGVERGGRGLVVFGIVVGIATLIGTAVAIVVALFGDDLTSRGFGSPAPPRSSEHSSVLATSGKGKTLSKGPVKVLWTGDGETLEVRWEPMSYPKLDHYSVDVYGKYPADTWANDGYRLGEKLDTFRIVHPVADTKYYYETVGKEIPPELGAGETWQICVTAMEASPVDEPGKVVEIKGSRRCSDTFTVPS